MQRNTSLIGALALATAAVWTASVHAAPIVNDTWLDGTRSDPAAPNYSENGTDTDTDGNLESAWFVGGGGTLDPAGAGGPLQGILAASGSSSWTTYFTPDGSPVTLGSPGHSLHVRWVFTPQTVGANNTSQNFRLALVDAPNAARLVADGAPGSSTYSGYGMFMNMSNGVLGNSNPFRLVERTNPTSTTALLSASAEWTGLINGATAGNAGYTSGTEYTFDMTITRNASDGLDISASMAGGNLNGTGLASLNFTDTTPNGGSFTFDTFSLRPSDAATTAAQFNTRLFFVEATVPEPASFGALTLVGLIIRRNRR